MLADLPVLSQDIFTVAASSLPAARSVLIIVNCSVLLDELTEHARLHGKGIGAEARESPYAGIDRW